MCADSSMIRAKTPPATLASPGSMFNTGALNTPSELGRGAREHLPEAEVRLEFVCEGEEAAVAPAKSGAPAPKGGLGGAYPRRGRDQPAPRQQRAGPGT